MELTSLRAIALDFAFTGFGTASYAISDEDFRYLRYIDDGGTFKADSLIGFQAEAALDTKWSATVQVVASAPRTRDEGHEVKLRWAFVTFRPSNDWLLRAGRVRPPFLINTQNAEVGVTYDPVRLPVEVYSLSPVYDFDGGALTRTWVLSHSELSVDTYLGKSDVALRLPFQRTAAPAGTFVQPFFPTKVTSAGLVLSHTSESLLVRGGVHQARVKLNEPIPEAYAPTAVPAPPPFGGIVWLPTTFEDRIDLTVLTVGADWHPGAWRITGEYAQRVARGSKLSAEGRSGYVTLARGIDKWLPYVTYARLLSGRDARALYRDIDSTPVPLAAQGPPFFLSADYHRSLADSIFVFDQYSTMLGTSYSFSATSKLKFEWMQTHVGLASALVDGDVHHRRFDVFTLAYSFAY